MIVDVDRDHYGDLLELFSRSRILTFSRGYEVLVVSMVQISVIIWLVL